MGQSIDFITDRATKTISAALQLTPGWTWQEQTPAQMQAALTALIGDQNGVPPVTGQEPAVNTAYQAMLAARGIWDTALDQLHRWTVQGVGMAKTKFRDDAAKTEQLALLSARGSSRSVTAEEALAWESAWASVAPAWAPLPANTLAAFRALRVQCAEDLKTAYSNAHAAWRAQAEKLAEMAAALEQVSEAWYADATRVFAPGTPEGDMIRGTIPTTYNPSANAPATPPTP